MPIPYPSTSWLLLPTRWTVANLIRLVSLFCYNSVANIEDNDRKNSGMEKESFGVSFRILVNETLYVDDSALISGYVLLLFLDCFNICKSSFQSLAVGIIKGTSGLFLRQRSPASSLSTAMITGRNLLILSIALWFATPPMLQNRNLWHSYCRRRHRLSASIALSQTYAFWGVTPISL